MFKSVLKYGSIALLTMFFVRCTHTKNTQDTVVAQVGSELLTASELAGIIPQGMDAQDSALMADDYVRKWVKQELLIQKANENLTPKQKDLTKEVREYRNSLIIYKYKNELMRQRMDTTVTDNQIENYYSANPENFKLNKNIVKAIFVKIPTEVANPDLLKTLADDTSEEGLIELRDYCVQYAKGFDIFIDNWVDFQTVKKNIPLEIDNDEQFLRRNSTIEITDSVYYYLVNIHDYKLQNELAPMEFMAGNIRNLILNQRKIAFLKELENNIYKEGIKQNKFKIFTNNDDTEQ